MACAPGGADARRRRGRDLPAPPDANRCACPVRRRRGKHVYYELGPATRCAGDVSTTLSCADGNASIARRCTG